MLSLLIFIAITYTIAFAGVYKKPVILRPFEWLFTQFGLGDAFSCMICLPFWAGMALAAVNLFLLPNLLLAPTLLIIVYSGDITWIEYIFHIVFSGLTAGSLCFLVDKLVDWFEFNSKPSSNNNNIILD
jgi:hypothetical protein